jgi:uncharacterized tellurite resistance protein B-like protein
MMKKIHLIKEKVKLKHLLGTYLKSNGYSCYEDAMYDVLKYMEEKDSQTISSSNIHYALKLKVDAEYAETLMRWAVSNSYFDASESGKKTTYTLVKSPFK